MIYLSFCDKDTSFINKRGIYKGIKMKKVKPRIISILTLDRLELTKKAVDSVLKLSGKDVKIILLDNGSTDGTLEYLSQLKKVYPSKVDYLQSTENLGVAAGRNRIFKHIISNYGENFEWVLSLDNDCIVKPGYDTAITRCIKETNALVVCPRLIQPKGEPYYNAKDGFMINLKDKQLKLERANAFVQCNIPKVLERTEIEIILGASAKTPQFFKKVGFYDEGHKIGWEDFSLALTASRLNKNDFKKWASQWKKEDGEWIPLKKLINGKKSSNKVLIMYEPECTIIHDHPLTEEYEEYEGIRRNEQTIEESTNHFEEVWGIRPVSNHKNKIAVPITN